MDEDGDERGRGRTMRVMRAMRGLFLVGLVALVLGVAFPVGALADGFSAGTSNPDNAITAAVLQPASGLTVAPINPTQGGAQLTWADTPSAFRQGYRVERGDASCASFPTLLAAPGGGYLQTGTGVNYTTASSSYQDTTAQYNQSYCYRVLAVYNNWTSGAITRGELSLAPASCADTTSGTTTVTCSTSALAAKDGTRYTTFSTWSTGSANASKYLQVGTAPPAFSGAVSKVNVTLVYQMSVANSLATFTLLVSPNGGSSWTSFTLPNPGTANTDKQVSVDVTSVINSASALSNMKLRFVADTKGGSFFKTSHDLIHVDVN